MNDDYKRITFEAALIYDIGGLFLKLSYETFLTLMVNLVHHVCDALIKMTKRASLRVIKACMSSVCVAENAGRICCVERV